MSDSDNQPQGSKRKRETGVDNKPSGAPRSKRKSGEKRIAIYQNVMGGRLRGQRQVRPDLCETLLWYKAYYAGSQGSADRGCYGILLDGNAGPRAYVDEEIIITRLGGAYSTDGGSGDLKLYKDQTFDDANTAKDMLLSIELGQPIGSY
ncbi:hypothetical protein N7540_002853 [Penicillium herquei]|nr:hypothetical protein N7540_002853 [Penicillium herquei]